MSASEPVRAFEAVRAERPDPAAVHPFEVDVLGAWEALSVDTRITIRDGWDEVQGEGEGRLKVSLPMGLYTVRLERAGAFVEKVVRHTGHTAIREPEPRRPSALPTFDTADAHEYYSYTAAELSRKVTGKAADVLPRRTGGGMGRLFLFVRAAEQGAHGGHDLAESLSLLTLDGEHLTDFTPDVVEQDRNFGWMAFSAPARAGTYVLRFAGLGARKMAITVFEGWESQLFIPFEHRPRFERSSFLMARVGQGFSPDDRVTQAVDAGLMGLRQGGDFLPKEERQMLLDGKFDNPLLGLVGAHLLLLAPEPNWWLFDIVMRNMESLLPKSADVRAVAIAAALMRNEPPPPEPLTEPPMLSRGLAAVFEASVVNPEIVPEGGFVERISPYLLADSPWTSWSLAQAGTPDELEQIARVEVEAEMERDDAGAMEAEEAGIVLVDREHEPTAERAMRAAARALPSVLSRLELPGSPGLSKAMDAVSETSVEDLARRARAGGSPALRKAAWQLVLDGVDVALRESMVGARDVDMAPEMPRWVKALLVEARQGGKADLPALARQARLPLGMLERAMREIP